MTRQYIGARYVPIFFDGAQGTEWLPNTQYEPLTIVTRNGNSYTSKRAVPAAIGAPESNSAYWASTGIYNQQVEQYREEVAQLSEDVDGYATRLSGIETDYGIFKDSYNSLKNRRFIFIGDSYAEGYSPDGSLTGWCELASSKLGLSASQRIISFHGGIGFARVQDGYTFVTMINDVAVSDPDSITDIVVAGGYNDRSETESAVRSAIQNFIHTAKTRFPNAKIHIGFIGYSITGDRLSFSRYAKTYRDAAADFGAAYMNGCELSLFDIANYFSSDGFHPNATGQDSIAQCAAQCILSGSVTVTLPYRPITLSNPELSLGRANSFGNSFYNGCITLYLLSKMAYTPTTPVNYGAAKGTTYIDLGEVGDCLINGTGYDAPVLQVSVMVHDGNSFYIMRGNIKFYNGMLKIALIDTNDTNSNWRSLTSISGIEIMPSQWTITADLS